MAAPQLRRQEQIQLAMIASTVARTDLSDVTDSSVIKHILAAVAREIDEVYYQLTRMSDLFALDSAAGDDLDARAKDIQPAIIERLGARRSVGELVFSRSGTTGTVSIPAGTLVKTSDGTEVQSTAQGLINNGDTESDPVPATAVTAGSAGNVGTGTLVKFGSKPAGIDAVTNPAAFTQGRDKESDDEFRARIKAFIATLARSTVQALEFVAYGVEDEDSGRTAVFTHVFEDPVDKGFVIVYVDDGNGTAESSTAVSGEVVIASALGGEEFLDLENHPLRIETPAVVTSSIRGVLVGGTYPAPTGAEVFVNPASGRLYFDPPLTAGEEITADYTYFTGLLAAVQRVIDGDPADRTNFPGWRSAGVLVRVLSPMVISIPVTATLSLLDGFDRDTAIAAAEDAATVYINGLGISGDVVRNELIQRIMEVPGVYDIALTLPPNNVVIADDEVARVSPGLLSIA